jgi:hypothetical protein
VEGDGRRDRYTSCFCSTRPPGFFALGPSPLRSGRRCCSLPDVEPFVPQEARSRKRGLLRIGHELLPCNGSPKPPIALEHFPKPRFDSIIRALKSSFRPAAFVNGKSASHFEGKDDPRERDGRRHSVSFAKAHWGPPAGRNLAPLPQPFWPIQFCNGQRRP